MATYIIKKCGKCGRRLLPTQSFDHETFDIPFLYCANCWNFTPSGDHELIDLEIKGIDWKKYPKISFSSHKYVYNKSGEENSIKRLSNRFYANRLIQLGFFTEEQYENFIKEHNIEVIQFPNVSPEYNYDFLMFPHFLMINRMSELIKLCDSKFKGNDIYSEMFNVSYEINWPDFTPEKFKKACEFLSSKYDLTNTEVEAFAAYPRFVVTNRSAKIKGPTNPKLLELIRSLKTSE